MNRILQGECAGCSHSGTLSYIIFPFSYKVTFSVILSKCRNVAKSIGVTVRRHCHDVGVERVGSDTKVSCCWEGGGLSIQTDSANPSLESSTPTYLIQNTSKRSCYSLFGMVAKLRD